MSVREKFKIVFLGQATVGKTSITNRLVRGTFNLHSDSTIGAAFSHVVIEDVHFDIWDTAGQERYHSLSKIYYRDADILIFVFDVNNLSTLDAIEKYYETVKKELVDDYTVIIVGNKMDLINVKNKLEQIQDYVYDKLSKYMMLNHLENLVYVSALDDNKLIELKKVIVNTAENIEKKKQVEIGINLERVDDNTSYLSKCKC